MKKRKSDHSGKVTRKREQLLQKMSKAIEKKRWQNQCDCLHTGDNGYDIRIAKKTKDEVVFECRNCKKQIYGNRLQEPQVNQAVKSIDMMCDTVKMNLNLRKPKDVRIANWISEFQFHDLHHIRLLYASTQNKEKNKRQPNADVYGKTFIRR